MANLPGSTILIVLQSSFNDAAKAFQEVPSSANFTQLHIQMYALQQARNYKPQDLVNKLENEKVGDWANILAAESVEQTLEYVEKGSLSAADLIPSFKRQKALPKPR